MIHSMSGGIISDPGKYTFVKVKLDGEDTPYWYICDFDVEEGDRVKAPRGAAAIPTPATVIRVERNVSGQVTPIPVKRAKKLCGKI